MRVVYEPANLIDAHLIKGMLEQSGLFVHLRGEYLTGAIGELPVAGMLALCVPDSCEAAARAVLDAMPRNAAHEADADHGEAGWTFLQA